MLGGLRDAGGVLSLPPSNNFSIVREGPAQAGLPLVRLASYSATARGQA